MSRFNTIAALVFLALILPTAAFAQQGETTESPILPEGLVTDRPDFTESSRTVPPMRLQLEAGIQYTHDDFPGGAPPANHTGNFDSNSVTAPNLLLRFGVTDFAELRLQVPNIAFESITGGDNDFVFGDVGLGAKLATSLSESIRIGVIPYGELGTESGDVAGGMIGVAAFDLSDDVGLAINAGIKNFEDALDERQWEWSGSAALGIGLSDRLGVFIESYALVPDDDFNLFVDTGITYALEPLVQLDAFMGTQVPDAEQIFMGMGISTLF